MKLTDLNRLGGIGANCLLVEIGGIRILIDCGLHPKQSGREAPPDLSLLEQHPPDAIIVTHCHLDHLGALPMVTRAHPGTPVMMSVPSSLLAERLLRNSVNVMKREREERGRADAVLYAMPDVDRAVSKIVPMLFGLPRRLGMGSEEIEITFHAAGHVTGAAGVEIVHKHRAIFFTGDVQFDEQRIVGGAKFPSKHFDTVVTETTRGSTERRRGETRATETARMLHAINATIQHGGSVLIPVFALGRMQEIFLVLNEARKRRELVECPVFAAGLGIDLCNIIDQISSKTGLANFSRGVLKELGVRPPPRNLVGGREPAEPGLYVLSSGMMVENTPSYTIASGLVGHPRHAIIFVGYCDPETPGGRLLAASKGHLFTFDAIDFQTTVRATVERFELTGHAERDELLEFALRADPRAIVLNHGDPPARQWFSECIAEQAPKVTVLDPTPLRTYEV